MEIKVRQKPNKYVTCDELNPGDWAIIQEYDGSYDKPPKHIGHLVFCDIYNNCTIITNDQLYKLTNVCYLLKRVKIKSIEVEIDE